ncbi:MAG: hypothetical protein ABR582_14895 [Gemmatimonadaceae bacterium]
MNSERHRAAFRFGAGPFGFVVLLSAIYFIASRPAVDSDYGWHVENGRHVTDRALFGGRDIYSWTAHGNLWVAHEWLTDAAMSAAHDYVGATLNSIAASLIVTAAFTLVALRLRKRRYSWSATLITTALAFLSSIMSLGVRPQVLELLYMAAALLFIDSWFRGAVPATWFYVVMALGSLLWANTHGSFPLLTAILVAVCVAFAIAGDPRWLSAGLTALLAFVMALINPWGIELYSFATQSITSETTLQSIEEWRRPNLFSGSLMPFVAELLLVVCSIPIAARQLLQPRFQTQHISAPQYAYRALILADVFIAAPITILGLKSGRHVMLAGVCGAPLIAWSIERAIRYIKRRRGWKSKKSTDDVRSREIINAIAATFVAITIVLQSWRIVSPEAQRAAITRRYPVRAVAYLEKTHQPNARLFNKYEWGGFIIERGRLKVFIDGRSEVYGDAQLARYASIIHMKPNWDRQLDTLGVNFVLMENSSPLVRALRASGWSDVARDSVGVLLRR